MREYSETYEKKVREIETLKNRKIYTSVEAVFPSGPAMIQFRNEIDRANLANVATAAMALASVDPTATVEYRTEDDVIQTVSAPEMIQIALGVMAAKQAITSAGWAHKDAIKAIANDRVALRAYDITTGWPA